MTLKANYYVYWINIGNVAAYNNTTLNTEIRSVQTVSIVLAALTAKQVQEWEK